MTTTSITVSQLESHLWEAANILRGPVDAADFKSYVFPLKPSAALCSNTNSIPTRICSTEPTDTSGSTIEITLSNETTHEVQARGRTCMNIEEVRALLQMRLAFFQASSRIA